VTSFRKNAGFENMSYKQAKLLRRLLAPLANGINFPNLLDSAEKTELLCTLSMNSNRFSFAFIYRYSFTGSGEADGVLRMR
jgi:hypothetical protein